MKAKSNLVRYAYHSHFQKTPSSQLSTRLLKSHSLLNLPQDKEPKAEDSLCSKVINLECNCKIPFFKLPPFQE